MLALITTLRHPQNSADYCRVESLLHDTLASLSLQSCDDYRMIIVGNRRPAFPLPERAIFVDVNFPPPFDLKAPQTGPAPVIWDKGTKIAIGLIAARDFGPEYVMAVDADDFVHRDVAAFARDHPGRAGWVVKRGWIYSRARNAYAPRRRFFRICGTSFIIPFDAYDVPPDLTVSATQREIAEAFGERLENVLEHGYAFDWWRKHGRVLEPVPSLAPSTRSTPVKITPAIFSSDRPCHTPRTSTTISVCARRRARQRPLDVSRAALKLDRRVRRQSFMRAKSLYLESYSPPGNPMVPSGSLPSGVQGHSS